GRYAEKNRARRSRETDVGERVAGKGETPSDEEIPDHGRADRHGARRGEGILKERVSEELQELHLCFLPHDEPPVESGDHLYAGAVQPAEDFAGNHFVGPPEGALS